MTNEILPTPKDNASGQLNASINASSASIVLKSGEGANFPQPISGQATSAGDATTLNQTGIGASGVAVGDFIFNLTDSTPADDEWAVAIVSVVDTNSLTTTPLRGGSANIWDSSDEWVVKPFVINLSARTGGVLTGAVTKYEKVLIKTRSTDTLTIPATTGYRGFDGTSPNSFSADDFVTIEVDQSIPDSLSTLVSQLFRNKAEDDNVIKKDGSVAFTANQPMGGKKLTGLAVGVDPTDSITKSQLDLASSALLYGDGSDGALSIPSGTTNLALNTLKNYSSIDIAAGAILSSAGQNGVMLIKCSGNCSIAGTVNLKGLGGLGAASVQAAASSASGFSNNASTNGDAGETADSDWVVDEIGHNGNGGRGASTVSIPSLYSAASGGSGGSGITDTTASAVASVGTASASAAAAALKIETSNFNFISKLVNVLLGSGGGSGGAAASSGAGSGGPDSATADSGAGGNGGGAIILLVGGNIDLTGATIDCSGDDGENGATSNHVGSNNGASAGGGGGGGGGGIFIIHKGTLTGTPTTDISGGAAGTKAEVANGTNTTDATDGTPGTAGKELIYKEQVFAA